MEWLDARWDESAELIKLDPALSYRGNTSSDSLHYVRETAYYSLGLFLRGDIQRATVALNRVLISQLKERNTEPCGGFLRHPEEVISSPKKAVEWVDFNPNWREYIGLALAIIVTEFADHLSDEMLKRTEEALRAATAGSLWRRVPAEYTHIAMLKAFLLSFCGVRFELEAWLEGGEMQGREIFRVFKEHRCFPCYNSPTHYGIDLLALALWRKYSPSNEMQAMAAEMQKALWEETARFYHAGMGNLVGPYDRAYGMDMRRYGSPLGLCLWASVGESLAPFPNLRVPFPQQHELAFAMPLLITGVEIPTELVPGFKVFDRERTIERKISAKDTVSAWMANELMLGARTSPPRNGKALVSTGFYPATVHWRAGDQIGWITAQSRSALNAHAGEKTLSLRTDSSAGGNGPVMKLLIHSPAPPILSLDKWIFPSLIVEVSSNLTFSAPAEHGGLFEIECRLPSDQREAFISLNFQK